MRSRFVLILLPLVLFFSCKSESEDLYIQVMAVHDEVMPKMDDIMKEKSRIQDLINESSDSARVQALEAVIVRLNDADESMMQWMRSFDRDKFADDPEARIDYYKEELIRINEVKDTMLGAINESKEIK